MEPSDRREYTRYKISTRAEVRYGGDYITVTTIDMSNTGILVFSPLDIDPGTLTNIAIGTPDEVILFAAVVRSVHTHGKDSDGYRLGFSISGALCDGSTHDDLETLDAIAQDIVARYG